MITVEQLVRRLDPADYKGPHSGTYLFDPSTNEIVPKRPVFGIGNMLVFEVTTSTTSASCASGTLEAVTSSDGTAGSWQLYIDYRAWILPKHVPDVLRACVATSSLRPVGEHLANTIVNVTQALADRDPSIFEKQDPERIEALQHEIAQILLRTCGLTTLLQIRTGGEASATTISAEVSAPTADFSTPIRVRTHVDTFVRSHEAADSQESLAAHPASFLQKLVQQATRETMSEVSTAQLRMDLDGEVTRRLRLKVEEQLSAFYVRVRALRLSLEEPVRAPPAEHELELSVQRSLRLYPNPIRVQARLHLQLTAESTYWSAGAPALETWAKTDAQRAVSRALHAITFSQLCLEPQRWEAVITTALQAAARKVGYELIAEVRLPHLPLNRYRAPFSLEVEGKFATATADLSTQLAVALSVQLDAFDSARILIDRGEDLDLVFQAAIHEELAACVHTLSPRHLLLAFQDLPLISPSSDGHPAQEVPATVESILHERIEQRLKREFGLRTLSFTAKLGHSPLGEVYDALMNASAIDFSVTARLVDHTVSVPHFGAIEVRAVHPDDWPLFQRKQPSPAQVAAVATRVMSTLIDQVSDSQRIGLKPGDLRTLALTHLPEELRKQLGLTVACVGWQRALGEDDDAWKEHHAKIRDLSIEGLLAEQKSLQKQIADLHARRRTALLAGEPRDAEQLDLQLRELHRQGGSAATSPRALLVEPPPSSSRGEN